MCKIVCRSKHSIKDMLIVHLISLSRFTSVMHEIWIVGVPDIRTTKLACWRQGVTSSTTFSTSFFYLNLKKPSKIKTELLEKTFQFTFQSQISCFRNKIIFNVVKIARDTPQHFGGNHILAKQKEYEKNQCGHNS